MPEFFIFLLKVNAALILFCLAYYLILRRLTFYTLNRFFLLAGIIFSSVYPFVDPSVLFAEHSQLIEPITTVVPVVMAKAVSAFNYWLLIKVVFWTGVAFMAIRTGVRFYSLYKVHAQSVPGSISEYPVRLLDGDVNTFSFWKNIYLNPTLHNPSEIDAVLEHEHVHVKQLHTLDILLAELTTVCYWFNPGVWYMRKAVKENVEFITDQKILQKGVDRKAYQYSMLHTAVVAQPSVLMNNFNITGIKRRIIMMNSRRSSKVQLVRYLFLLPVLLVLTTAFTLFKTEIKSSQVYQKTLETASYLLPAEPKDSVIVTPVKVKPVRLKRAASPKKLSAELTLRVSESDHSAENEELVVIGRSMPKIEKPSSDERVFVIAESPSGDTINVRKRIHVVARMNMERNSFSADPEPADVSNTIKGVGAIKGDLKEITVVGKPSKSKQTQILHLNYSTKTGMSGAKMYIDDQEASPDQVKGLVTSEIAGINVNKDDADPAKSSIRIYTKNFKN
ncbi:M56 family metallopeptidase [Pedobacter metabolipauper]|uniref:BlaR1 peptidase M56 n=1 Tax=Pedobacter metabolipauper TaxID=425513 RepID=A0A4R6SRI5_9SPHI|nr:M56 family metallopeptidase [Pedobacter metabolipauper]TDQ06990.1 BlaR1 peptidase M56 [Pedobacter metabolipauper]